MTYIYYVYINLFGFPHMRVTGGKESRRMLPPTTSPPNTVTIKGQEYQYDRTKK